MRFLEVAISVVPSVAVLTLAWFVVRAISVRVVWRAPRDPLREFFLGERVDRFEGRLDHARTVACAVGRGIVRESVASLSARASGPDERRLRSAPTSIAVPPHRRSRAGGPPATSAPPGALANIFD